MNLFKKGTDDSERLKVAIAYLNKARELIEAEANASSMDREDLQDVADDLGPILYVLESFGG